MVNTNTITVEPVIKKLQVKETAVMLTATILIQFMIHLIPPVNNIPLGAVLLPMFYIPLIALIFYKFHVGLLAAILGPILNYSLTGSPGLEIVSLLTLELIAFVSVLAFLLRYNKINKVSALIAIIFAKLLSWLVFTTFSPGSESSTNILIQSFINAIPGIFVLALLNILLLYIKDRI
jgi:hypothetical protein